MRYLVMGLMILLNIFIAGGAFGAVSPFGLAPDLFICFMVSVVVMEKSLAGMWLGVINGLLLDVLYSSAIGFYAIPYALTGSILFFVTKRFRLMDNFFIPAGVAFGAFVIRDVIQILLSYLMGININAGFVIVRFTLLSALETAAFMIPLHLLFRWLYRIRVLKTLRYDDLKM